MRQKETTMYQQKSNNMIFPENANIVHWTYIIESATVSSDVPPRARRWTNAGQTAQTHAAPHPCREIANSQIICLLSNSVLCKY